MNVDFSFLTTKKLVYHRGVPYPFAIYEGMVESIYMLSNSVAYSSLVSPGFYKLLRDFVQLFPGPLSIVDDLLGMCVLPDKKNEEKSVHYSVHTTSFIQQLMSLNRISWQCPHKEGSAHIPDEGVVWVANPLAFMNYHRLNEINAEVVNKHQNTTFIIPAGTSQKATNCLQFYVNYVRRDVVFGTVPCALIDDCVVIIPAKGLRDLPKVPGLTLDAAPRLFKSAKNWSIELERQVFQSLYG